MNYVQVEGSDVRHVIDEVLPEGEVRTACGRVLAGRRIGEDVGELCDNCLAKVA